MTSVPLIFGASGLLGSFLFDYFKKKNTDTIGTYSNNPKPGLIQFKLGEDSLSKINIENNKSYTAIICSSITNIKYIEDNPDITHQTNVHGTLKLVKELYAANITVLFVSSDNVYRGSDGDYSAGTRPVPVSTYGIQKLIAEDGIKQLTDNSCIIIRLPKIVGHQWNDKTILNDIYDQLMSPAPVKAATDLIFNPTFIADIGKAIEKLITKPCFGTFNFCSPKKYSRYELSLLIAEKAGISNDNITPVKMADIFPSVNRPLNTSMVCSDRFEDFNFTSIPACIDMMLDQKTTACSDDNQKLI